MPYYLAKRDTESTERMDDPNCDRVELENTYRQFHIINALIARWYYIYKRMILPNIDSSGTTSILDIGFGGGDIPIKLAQWARKDDVQLSVTGIENDSRAYEFVQKNEIPQNVEFRLISSTALLKEGKQFDFVISNHLLHHLDTNNLKRLLSEAKSLSQRMVIFNDIRRSDIGYLLFNLFSRPVFRSSFITSDGLTSIKRSYTVDELSAIIPEDWEVHRLFPFRLLLTYRHD